MHGSMADEQDRFICVGDGSPLSLGSLARIDPHAKTYAFLNQASADLRLDPREHLLARITPRELVFIQYTCLHPEQTDEEIRDALGLRESEVLAYYAHLDRNFDVRTSAELRHWAFENRLVPMPDDGPQEDGPTEGFDPWVRRF